MAGAPAAAPEPPGAALVGGHAVLDLVDAAFLVAHLWKIACPAHLADAELVLVVAEFGAVPGSHAVPCDDGPQFDPGGICGDIHSDRLAIYVVVFIEAAPTPQIGSLARRIALAGVAEAEVDGGQVGLRAGVEADPPGAALSKGDQHGSCIDEIATFAMVGRDEASHLDPGVIFFTGFSLVEKVEVAEVVPGLAVTRLSLLGVGTVHGEVNLEGIEACHRAGFWEDNISVGVALQHFTCPGSDKGDVLLGCQAVFPVGAKVCAAHLVGDVAEVALPGPMVGVGECCVVATDVSEVAEQADLLQPVDDEAGTGVVIEHPLHPVVEVIGELADHQQALRPPVPVVLVELAQDIVDALLHVLEALLGAGCRARGDKQVVDVAGRGLDQRRYIFGVLPQRGAVECRDTRAVGEDDHALAAAPVVAQLPVVAVEEFDLEALGGVVSVLAVGALAVKGSFRPALLPTE